MNIKHKRRGNSYFSSLNFKRSCLACETTPLSLSLSSGKTKSQFRFWLKTIEFPYFHSNWSKGKKQIFFRLNSESIGLDLNLRKRKRPLVKSTAADKDVSLTQECQIERVGFPFFVSYFGLRLWYQFNTNFSRKKETHF